MDKDALSHLFEPFYTTKDMGKGTGLGLATVYGAVKQNNGYINVYSEPGQGTTVKIYLPRHVEKDEKEKETAPEQDIPEKGNRTILLVEDEPALLKMAETMLQRLGYRVLAADTTEKALKTVKEYKGKIDLVMTDVVMPGMNGWDLTKEVASLYPGIKEVYMSGYTADIIAQQGVLEEGVHFIQKPFTLKTLSLKLREVLG